MSASEQQTDFLFMIGSGRCGSTQLAHIVASHDQVGFISNVERQLPRLIRSQRLSRSLLRFGGPANLTTFRDTRHRLASRAAQRVRSVAGPTEAYDLLAEEVSSMIAAPCRDLTADDASPWVKERFRRFFTARANQQGTPLFLHKFTGWPRARFIDAILPEAKFVHIVRDGRAVANSLMKVRFWRGYRGPTKWNFGPLPEAYAQEWEASGQSFAVLAGLEWKMIIDAHEEAERAIPEGRWLNVRYEDFTTDTRAVVERVLRFAGLEWTSTIERQLRNTPISSERQQAYLQEMAPTDVAALTRSLASHLERWGYSDDSA
jgi:omega-hydroxy-beta-dihydromenaquinone-9 sulfotransferase